MKIRKIFKLIFLLFIISSTCFVNSGFSMEITRNRMNALNDPSGWGVVTFGGKNVNIVSSDSPDGGTMLQYTFPIGLKDGQEPGTVYYFGSSNLSEMYVQFYHKYSSNFVWHPIGNKLVYFYSDGDRESHGLLGTLYGDLVFQVYGTNNDLVSYGTNTGLPTKGVWYKYNIHTKANTSPGSHDGILQVWVNDVLKINKSDVMYFGPGTKVTGFRDISLAAAYGGLGGSNPVVSYSYYDDFIVSGTTITGNTTLGAIPNRPINLQITQ